MIRSEFDSVGKRKRIGEESRREERWTFPLCKEEDCGGANVLQGVGGGGGRV